MNKFEFNKLCPFKWFVLENFPFIEADFDAITNYQLYCKVVEYLNKVIENNNAIGIQTENLTNAFIELQDYVNNYFDNLDVQDEINNKLDDMVESGTLQEIIADYLNSKAIFGFDNVASMKQATNLINGSFAKTLGFYNKNDGGSATYKIRNITNEDIIDEMTIISLNNTNLIAELIVEDIIPVESLGAYGDNIHDDSDYIIKAISFGCTILFGNKTYKCDKQITINNHCKFLGVSNPRLPENRTYIDFSENSDNECFILATKGIIFENLNFKGLRSKHIGFTIENNSRYTFKNCGFYYFNKAIYTNRAWSTSFYDCVFEYCETCIEFNGVNTSFLFNGTIFYSSTNGIVSNQELDYSNIVGGGFDHVDTCINLVSIAYSNNITLLNCGFEDYITGIIALGNSQATVISCTFVNTERSVETYKGAGKIVVINGRSDTALTPNKKDVMYISPILPSNANVSNDIIVNNQKNIFTELGTTKFYNFVYVENNNTYIDINYDSNTQFDIKIDVASTEYPETFHFTKYSSTITKTQGNPVTFTWVNDTTNNRVRITFNRSCNIHVQGYMKYSGNIS